jgi:DNA helicase-2/ATP-dependent DNA helicase PcrA
MYRAYQQYLREKDWIDYSDMLFITYKYLSDERNADFRSMVVNKIDYLLVDEAQDMNKISYELYKIFGSKHNNIMMVGDVRQSIYGFIGSSGDYMLKFIDNYKANVINLPLNYRSTKNIIEASNNLIKVNNIPMIEDCYTVNDVGPNIQILRNDDEINEAIHIVDSIKGYIEAGIEPKDIAVVYRINAQAFPIVDMLTLENIPFILHNNDSFFTRREIRQVMTYLTAFIAPEALEFDDFALISNAPVRYIKKTTLDYIDNNNSGDYYEELKKAPSYLSGKEAGPILNLINDIEKGIKKAANGASTSDLLEYIFDDLGLLDYLKTPDSANSDMESGGADNDRLLNVEVLSSLSCKYTVPKDFVHYAQQMKEKSKEKKKNKNGVNLMSVHGSKGLEFEVVFVAGCCSRLYPFYRSANDDKLIEEERRLMYVAITRPKRFLNLSTINGRFGRYKVKPSFFIDEMRIPNGKVNIADRCEKHFVPPQLHI